MERQGIRKEKIGVVKSNKMDKSIVVSVMRKVKHPKYGKFVNKTSSFVAHDEKNECAARGGKAVRTKDKPGGDRHSFSQDLALVEAVFEPDRQNRLPDLARESAFIIAKPELDQLLSDRASAAANSPGAAVVS